MKYGLDNPLPVPGSCLRVADYPQGIEPHLACSLHPLPPYLYGSSSVEASWAWHRGEDEPSHPAVSKLQEAFRPIPALFRHRGAGVTRQPSRLRGADFAAPPRFSRLSHSPRLSPNRCRFLPRPVERRPAAELLVALCIAKSSGMTSRFRQLFFEAFDLPASHALTGVAETPTW